jgi:hypothetical protein
MVFGCMGSVKGRPTFVYYSSHDHLAPRLRNIRFEQDFFRQWILNSRHKAETHRLGYELSEDAVTWNVFVALHRAGLLSKVMCWLAGREIAGSPELYLWRCHIDLQRNTCEPYGLLQEARSRIELDIKRFPTEPDIMLVVPGKFLMCIEAKFTSGNTLAVGTSTSPLHECLIDIHLALENRTQPLPVFIPSGVRILTSLPSKLDVACFAF